ncbi:MAG: tetratricopeptide repeat protein [Acidobacteria bacterium]|nr:tetratricopeptide repeat protein [Acidobacteriota bacterium]
MLPLLLLAFWLQAADPAAEGMKALEGQRYDEAAKLFAQAVEKDKDDLSAQFHLGLSLSLLNRDGEAIAAYKKVLAAKPGLYEAQLNLGVLHLRQKQFAEAAALLDEARKQKPAEYRPNYYMGEALLGLSKPEEAEAPLRAALQADAKRPEAMVAMGRALARQGRVKESATWFEGAAQTEASYRDALLELASHYEQSKNREGAIAIYKQFPDNAGARERMGVLLLESGQAADAVAELEGAVKTSPTAANRFALATAYLKAKQNDKALPLIAAAVQQEPRNVELRLTLGRLLREAKNLPAAAQEFYNAAQADAKATAAWRELASTLFLLGNYQGTLGAFDKLRALGEETPAQWYLRALCYDRMQLYKEALPAYEKFLAVSDGKSPEEEFKARQRIRVVKKVLEKK